MKQHVELESEGAVLRGYLYLPEAKPPYAAVIMAPDFSATISMAVDRYAEVFQAAGLAVLLYDHRNLGMSSGEPRQEINPWIQARGYRDALGFLSARPDIAEERIALWGSGDAAAQAMVLGATDTRVAAVVAQTAACGRRKPDLEPSDELFDALREALLRGDVRAASDAAAFPRPVVSTAQLASPSHLKPLTAFRWFLEYGGRFGSLWQNAATRIAPATPVPLSPYLAAPYLKADLLMIAAPGDEVATADPAVARAIWELVPGHKEYAEIPGGHFGLLYPPGDLFERASTIECDFLVRRLGVRAAERRAAPAADRRQTRALH